ncbi:MAG: FAD/NAD(P)-binding protein [Pseudomonadales bacterium]|jgi:NAD(P)H-flavin reductase|nr:FAD/NAD(P)-binding protein [Pseudomonadales bacterium]
MACTCNDNNDSIFLPQVADIIDAQMITATEKHFTLKLQSGDRFDYEPGQIVEAGLFGYGEVPLGLASSPTNGDSFDLVVRVLGKVTKALGDLSAGDTMTIRGPLGNGFPVDEFKGEDVLIVAGGIGLCPVRSMIEYILHHRDDFGKFTLFFGAKSPHELLFEEDLEKWRCDSCMSYLETVDTPDAAWKGNVGVITTLFEKTEDITPETKVIICGPPIMYKFVIMDLDKLGVPRSNIFVDLERRMKCGVGKCGHCQINDKYVCMDGPVFRYSEIETLEEAI